MKGSRLVFSWFLSGLRAGSGDFEDQERTVDWTFLRTSPFAEMKALSAIG